MSRDNDNLGDEIRRGLDDLVSNNLASNDIDLPGNVVEEVEPLNLKEVSRNATAKAQKTVLSCLKLYFDEKLISKNEFLQAKSAVATSNITALFKQLKLSEHMMEKLINEIDNGNLQPRMFEVATSVQNTIIDLLKNTQLHVISMQEDMKRMKNELPLSETDRVKNVDITDNSKRSPNTYLNSKNMLKEMEDDEDVDD